MSEASTPAAARGGAGVERKGSSVPPRDVVRVQGKFSCPLNASAWRDAHLSLRGEWAFNVDLHSGYNDCAFETHSFSDGIPTTKTVTVPMDCADVSPTPKKAAAKRKLVLPARVPAGGRLFFGSFATSKDAPSISTDDPTDMRRHAVRDRISEVFYLVFGDVDKLGEEYLSELKDDTTTIPKKYKQEGVFLHGQGANRYGIFEIKGYAQAESGEVRLEKKYIKRAKRTAPAVSAPPKLLATADGERRKKKLRGLTGGAVISGAYFYPSAVSPSASYRAAPAVSKKKKRARSVVRRFVRSRRNLDFYPYYKFDFGLKFPPKKSGTAATPRKASGAAAAVLAPSREDLVVIDRVFDNSAFENMVPTSLLPCVNTDDVAPTTYTPKRVAEATDALEFLSRVIDKQRDDLTSTKRTNNKLRHKKYIFELKPHAAYEGRVDEAGRRCGVGVCGYSSGNLYYGEFRKNVESGKGELYDAHDNLVYRGDFENGKISGRGEFFYDGGDVYFGEVKESTRHGAGRTTYLDGSTYDGEYVSDVRAGFGSFVHGANGSNYTGEWVGNFRNGRGILQRYDGLKIDGAFRFNQPNGRATVNFGDGSTFQGTMKAGLMYGRGTYAFVNGCVFEGRFAEDGVVAGPGSGSFKMPPRTTALDARTGNTLEARSFATAKDILIPLDAAAVTRLRFSHRKAGF